MKARLESRATLFALALYCAALVAAGTGWLAALSALPLGPEVRSSAVATAASAPTFANSAMPEKLRAAGVVLAGTRRATEAATLLRPTSEELIRRWGSSPHCCWLSW